MVNPEPLEKLGHVYDTLSHIYTLLGNTDTSAAIDFFSDKESKQVLWLNEFIAGLEKVVDWPNFVQKGKELNQNA